MDSSNYQKSDPAILLHNEIEILLTQIRLMELYVKQAKATAANEADQLRDKHETELAALRTELALKEQALPEHEQQRIRDEIRSELAALRAKLEQKNQELQQLRASSRELEQGLRGRIRHLQTLLAEKEDWLEVKGREAQSAGTQIAELQQRVTELEAAKREEQTIAARALEQLRERFDVELASLQATLGEKERAARASEAAVAAIERQLQNHIHDLRNQLEQKEALLEAGENELQNVRSHAVTLQERVVRLESEKNEAEFFAASEIDRLRKEFEAELAPLREELKHKEQILDNRQAAASVVELSLHGKIEELHGELAQKRNFLEERDAELQNARVEIALLREKISQLEAARREAEENTSRQADEIRAELTALSATLEQKNQALEDRDTVNRSLEDRHATEIRELHKRLAEAQTWFDNRDTELQRAKSEMAALQDEKSQLEFAQKQTERLVAAQAEQIRESVGAELAHLDSRLKEKEEALRMAQATTTALEESFKSKIMELQLQLAEKHLLLEGRVNEIADLKGSANSMLEHIAQHEAARQQAEINASRLEQLRQNATNEITALKNKLQRTQAALEKSEATAKDAKRTVEATQAELTAARSDFAQRERALAESQAATASMERGLKNEIHFLQLQAAEQQRLLADRSAELRARFEAELADIRAELELKTHALRERENVVRQLNALRTEAKEKHLLLESRNEELVRVKAAKDLLQEQFTQLESTAKQADTTAASESERMRTEFQAQLAFLQAELSQKEWALEERQAMVNAVEQGLRAQIQDLQTQLTEKQALLESRTADFVLGESRTTDAQKERFDRLQELIEPVQSVVEQAFPAASSSRWRTAWGWKRRWKS